MDDSIEMVYSLCAEWLDDWISVHSPVLIDEYDLAQWMKYEMQHAIDTFITYGFVSPRAKNDALIILRSLVYEYFQFKRQQYISQLQACGDSVARLLSLPQTNQKSAQWHAETRDLLSGHEFGHVCFGSENEKKAIIAKKCGPPIVIEHEEVNSRTVYLTNEEGKLSAFKWGWRYEPIARMLFETVVNGKIHDGLGRIRHPTLPRLGASPDGLILEGTRCGRLVEIKCPLSRVITGSVPVMYYCQMQLQAEVCDVEAVEYVEVSFGSQSLVTADQATICKQSALPFIGKVCVLSELINSDPSTYTYEYSPLFPSNEEGWKNCMKWKPPSHMYVHECAVWYVKDWHTQTIPRNRQWFEDIGKPAYESFWHDVDTARREGTYQPKFLGSDSDE